MTARRVATGLALTAVVATGAALGGCSDDGETKPKATTTTVDRAAVALEVQCELIKSYMNFESARVAPQAATGSTTATTAKLDPATVAQFEERRAQALSRLVDSFKGAVPTELAEPLADLKTASLAADPQPYEKVKASLVKVTGYFDPKCGTEGGKDKDTSSTAKTAGSAPGATSSVPSTATSSTGSSSSAPTTTTK